MNYVRRVILVNNSRLLLGMLRRVIEKARHLEVVGEMVDLQNLGEKIRETNADLIIMDREQEARNLGAIQELMNAYPSVRFMTVTADGSQVCMKRLGLHEENLSDLTLYEILKVLDQQR